MLGERDWTDLVTLCLDFLGVTTRVQCRAFLEMDVWTKYFNLYSLCCKADSKTTLTLALKC